MSDVVLFMCGVEEVGHGTVSIHPHILTSVGRVLGVDEGGLGKLHIIYITSIVIHIRMIF